MNKIIISTLLLCVVSFVAATDHAFTWTFPSGSSFTPLTVAVGDTVTFQFSTGSHDVWSLPDNNAYSQCDLSAASSLSEDGPYTWTASSTGTFYMACSFSGHCNGGMKIQVTVQASSGGSSSATAAASTSTAAASTAAAAASTATATSTGGSVNHAFTWQIQSYTPLSVAVGDTVTFQFSTGAHNVYLFPTQTAFTNCDFSSATSLSTTGPYTYTAATAGTFYMGCSFSGHCNGGMKIQITVGGGTTTGAATTGSGATTRSDGSHVAVSAILIVVGVLAALL